VRRSEARLWLLETMDERGETAHVAEELRRLRRLKGLDG
jgi:hypothetical protein